MKTPFYHIFDADSVGKMVNPLPLNQILKWASLEEPRGRDMSEPKIVFLGIDIQRDFIDNGALGVPGAAEDVARLSRFLYEHADELSAMIVSLDTHEPRQIFHPCWWRGADGSQPEPFTVIEGQDLTDGIWKAVIDPALSKNYVRQIEKAGKQLCIWPYHCIDGTTGQALETQFANVLHFISLAQDIPLTKIRKGQYQLSEMYGIFKPEYSMSNDTNTELLEKIADYDKIIVAGEAKSHCVLESVRQFCEYFYDKPEITRKLYTLTDCMSDIPGFEKQSETGYSLLAGKYKINLVRSTDDFL